LTIGILNSPQDCEQGARSAATNQNR